MRGSDGEQCGVEVRPYRQATRDKNTVGLWWCTEVNVTKYIDQKLKQVQVGAGRRIGDGSTVGEGSRCRRSRPPEAAMGQGRERHRAAPSDSDQACKRFRAASSPQGAARVSLPSLSGKSEPCRASAAQH